MQKIKDSYLTTLILIGFIIFGILVGITLGDGFDTLFVRLDEAGAFGGGSWKLLDSPIKFTHIVDATTLTIWAKTREDKLYKQTYCLSDQDCNQWTETKEVIIDPGGEGDLDIINKSTCTPSGLKYPRDLHGNVLECALATRYWSLETKDIIYYALLADGTIWVWRSSGPWYVGLSMFIMLISPFVGLVFGLLAFRSFQKYQKKRKTVIEGNNTKQ